MCVWRHLKIFEWCVFIVILAISLLFINLIRTSVCIQMNWNICLLFLNIYLIFCLFFEFLNARQHWRARSWSHLIDSGYEVIDDITLARAEMRLALASRTNVISDRELSLTTWFLSVTIWANYLKPQFQRRCFGLQPFNCLSP